VSEPGARRVAQCDDRGATASPVDRLSSAVATTPELEVGVVGGAATPRDRGGPGNGSPGGTLIT
jgi:hypothetical protein